MLLKKKAQEGYQTNIQKQTWLCESWMSLEQNLFQSNATKGKPFQILSNLATPRLGLPQ